MPESIFYSAQNTYSFSKNCFFFSVTCLSVMCLVCRYNIVYFPVFIIHPHPNTKLTQLAAHNNETIKMQLKRWQLQLFCFQSHFSPAESVDDIHNAILIFFKQKICIPRASHILCHVLCHCVCVFLCTLLSVALWNGKGVDATLMIINIFCVGLIVVDCDFLRVFTSGWCQTSDKTGKYETENDINYKKELPVWSKKLANHSQIVDAWKSGRCHTSYVAKTQLQNILFCR